MTNSYFDPSTHVLTVQLAFWPINVLTFKFFSKSDSFLLCYEICLQIVCLLLRQRSCARFEVWWRNYYQVKWWTSHCFMSIWIPPEVVVGIQIVTFNPLASNGLASESCWACSNWRIKSRFLEILDFLLNANTLNYFLPTHVNAEAFWNCILALTCSQSS